MTMLVDAPALDEFVACAPNDDDELLKRVQGGDEDACEALVRRFGGRMLAAAQRLLRNEDDAHDAVQDAFLSAFRAIHRFEGRSQLGTWLHRIVINSALMKLRARKRRRDCSIDELLPTFDVGGQRRDARPGWQPESEAILEREELRARIRRKIDVLPDDYRTVILLRDIEELSTEETASVLGINTGAVKTRLHRARMALRTLLEAEMGEMS